MSPTRSSEVQPIPSHPAAATRLDEIRERVEAATPGPWDLIDMSDWASDYMRLDEESDRRPDAAWLKGPAFIDLEEEGNYFTGDDAAFIAHAREDIPYLLAEVERLRSGSLDEARRLVDEQAEDEGLWFIAETAPEAYLQQELRRLHAVIEAKS